MEGRQSSDACRFSIHVYVLKRFRNCLIADMVLFNIYSYNKKERGNGILQKDSVCLNVYLCKMSVKSSMHRYKS